MRNIRGIAVWTHFDCVPRNPERERQDRLRVKAGLRSKLTRKQIVFLILRERNQENDAQRKDCGEPVPILSVRQDVQEIVRRYRRW